MPTYTLQWFTDSAASAATTTANANETRYAKFIFKDPDVRAVYIDWDDGESNKKTEANYQWVEFTEPLNEVVLAHTYNKTGNINPVYQTINSRGIASRYWSNEATGNYDNILAPVSQTPTVPADYSMNQLTVSDNTAIANMRVQSRNVLSGIDNSLMEREGGHTIYATIPPTLTDTEIAYAPNPISLRVKALVENPTAGGNVATMEGQNQVGYSLIVKEVDVDLPSTTSLSNLTGNFVIDFGVPGNSVQKVLSVRYNNPKLTGSDATDYTKNAALNKLKIFVTALSREDGLMFPITYVSPGSPYKRLEDTKRYITMDFSQSRPAASNVTNAYYYYDNGKGFFSPDYQRWAISSGKFTDTTKTTKETKQVHYTYNPRPQGVGAHTAGLVASQYTLPFGTGSAAARSDECNWYWSTGTDTATKQRTNQFILDDFGRFFPTAHLVRNSMEPSSAANKISSLSGNAVSINRITPVIDFQDTTSNTTLMKGAKLDGMQDYGGGTVGTPLSGCYTEGFDTQAFNNNTTDAAGMINCSGMNTAAFGSWNQAFGAGDSESLEYFLCLWDSKTNEIFIQNSPYWNAMQAQISGNAANTRGLTIAGVSYLRVENSGNIKQKCEWVPLEFNDGTKGQIEYKNTTGTGKYQTIENSLVKPGTLSFDMPLDWSSIKMEELYGGMEPGSSNTASDPFGSLTTSIITVTGSTPAAPVTQYGSGLTWTSAAGVITGSMSGSSLTGEEIGAFKYMAQVRTDADNKIDLQNVWCAKILSANTYSNGYVDGTDELFMHFGQEVTTTAFYKDPTAVAYSIFLRRINFYEVFPGASKLYTEAGGYMNPVDAGMAAAFPNQYGFSDYTTPTAVGKLLKDVWYQNSKYPLLLTISGNMVDPTPAGGGDAFHPEMWNVLDATEGFTTTVIENDDSAYNLSSIPITSDVSIGRGSNFYTAITRKGKVFITKTGIKLTEIGFSSVALADENTATVANTSAGSTYDFLRKLRRLQAEAVRVYWDEKQKDGTYVRFWGYIRNVNETRGTGGPRAIMNYTFTLTVEEIALLDPAGVFMTDIFPLGGIENERNYS